MIKSEMSQIVDIRTIPDAGKTFDLKATPAQLTAIADRLKLVGLKNLTAHVHVKGHTQVKVTGRFDADVTYQCVVTLDAFDSHVSGTFETVFEKDAPDEVELDLDMAAEDTEPLTGDQLDIGEYVIQQLALALDPFPKKNKELSFSYKDEGFDEEEIPNPFEKLKALKN